MTTNNTYKWTYIVTSVLGSIGAINWGLVGLFNFNLVSYLFNEGSILTKTVYIAVGLSGIHSLFYIVKKYTQ